MLNNLIQQFAGGNAQSMSGEELHGGVNQLLQTAEPGHSTSAIGEALGALGSGGFGRSITEAASSGGPARQGGIASMLMSAVEQGGGSRGNALQAIGAGGRNPEDLDPQQLGQLGEYVHQNHMVGLSSLLGSQVGSGGGGGGMLSLLGNPMVRQIGMQLAKKML